MDSYKIVRYFKSGEDIAVTQKTGLSLQEAQKHCRDEATSGDDFFDGYVKE